MNPDPEPEIPEGQLPEHRPVKFELDYYISLRIGVSGQHLCGAYLFRKYFAITRAYCIFEK